MREKPRPKKLAVQTFGTARVIRIVCYNETASAWVDDEARAYGKLRKERGAGNIFWLEVDEAYDQIEVEAYIASYDERR